jgi:hypothetical protein
VLFTSSVLSVQQPQFMQNTQMAIEIAKVSDVTTSWHMEHYCGSSFWQHLNDLKIIVH